MRNDYLLHAMNEKTAGLFPPRITRTSFFIRGALLLCGAFMAAGMLSLTDHAGIAARIVLIGGAVPLLVFLFTALFRSILIPRLRDIGLHPAWSLLVLVHSLDFFFLLALLLIPADAFAKRSYPV